MGARLGALVQGSLTSGQLPHTMDVWDLEEGLSDLLHRSAEGRVEWGACMVTHGGKLQLAHVVHGRMDGVDPFCRPEDHDNYVGFAHIHLPDDKSGQPYLGFSERDFRATLADGDNLALVCNGPEVFTLVRTADCTQPPRTPSQAEFRKWEEIFRSLIQQARERIASDPAAREWGSVALNQALWEANREMCRLLGFAFYAGHWAKPLRLVFRPWRERG